MSRRPPGVAYFGSTGTIDSSFRQVDSHLLQIWWAKRHVWLSPDFAPGSDVPESHTSTSEWQNFESRMRRRRADRCLLRASAALDADVPDIAQQVLEEARALDPQHPELQEVTGRLLAASNPAAAMPRRPAHDLVSPVLIALLVLALVWAAASMEAAGVKALLKQVLTVGGSMTTYLSQSAVHVAPAIPLQPTGVCAGVTMVYRLGHGGGDASTRSAVEGF